MGVLPRRCLLPLAAGLTATRAGVATSVVSAISAGAETPPVVVASFSILGDMVRQIAGEGVALRVLAGPETDAHAFQPRPSEAAAVRGAVLVVRNGLGFEPWLDRLLRGTGYAGRIATATQGIAARVAGQGAGQGPDPHAWQDVRLAQAYARTIGEALAAALPAHEAELREAASDYAARLGQLDGWVRDRLAVVPAERRVVVTSHDAFGYIAAAYGVRLVSPQGAAATAQPSAAQVAALIRLIRDQRISAVFIEGLGSQAVMQRLARDAGVRLRGRLFADTLSVPDGPAPTYEAMVRHNLDLLVPAMLGD